MTPGRSNTTDAPRGVCRVCGCTNHRGCRLPTGDSCLWVDRHQTLCSNPCCVEYQATEELGRLEGFPEAKLTIQVTPFLAVALVANMQLALRHPGNTGPSAEGTRTIARGIIKLFKDHPTLQSPAIVAMLEMGWDHRFDLPNQI